MFEWITRVIGRLGYTGVALLTFLENLLPPIPSELVIPLAGFAAAQGDMRLSLMIVAATVGSLVGATVWYVVGRSVGEVRLRVWIGRHGKWLTLSPKDLDRAQAWFRDHGNAAVFLGRLLPGLRTFVSVPAGFARMPVTSYLLYSALGTVLWTTALAYAGVALQSNLAIVGNYIDALTYGIFGAMGVMIARRYIRCWKDAQRDRLMPSS
jgi:membrane protein DedA with SNARE-associated domain